MLVLKAQIINSNKTDIVNFLIIRVGSKWLPTQTKAIEMRIEVRNQTDLPNKYVRFIKWKLYGLSRKFKHLIYAEVYLRNEGKNPLLYIANVKLGIPGNDIILTNKEENMEVLFQKSIQAAHRYLSKTKSTAAPKKNNYEKV